MVLTQNIQRNQWKRAELSFNCRVTQLNVAVAKELDHSEYFRTLKQKSLQNHISNKYEVFLAVPVHTEPQDFTAALNLSTQQAQFR